MSILLKYDPENGDLGRGEKVTALELAVVAPHIANILSALRNLTPQTPYYKYGFEVWLGDRNKLDFAISDVEQNLPANVFWYSIDDKKVFELRSASGGITDGYYCCLITR